MAGAVVLSAVAGAGIHAMTAEPVIIDNKDAIASAYEKGLNDAPIQVKTEYVDRNVTVEKNVTVEVPVDNGNLGLILDEIYDNDGSVSYLTEDLDDDELDLIVDRIVFVNDAKALAVQEVEKEAVDMLHKEDVNGTTLDEDDIERVRVQDEDDEVSVDDVDYEDKDADVFVDVNFEQKDVKYTAKFKVEIKDGEVDDLDLESIELR